MLYMDILNYGWIIYVKIHLASACISAENLGVEILSSTFVSEK